MAASLVAACTDPPADDRTATEAVFLETCAPGGTAVEVEVCRCAFERITEDLTPAQLERLDRNLRDDPDTVPDAVVAAGLECATEPLTPAPPASPAPTTSTSSTRPDDEDRSTTTPRPGGDDPGPVACPVLRMRPTQPAHRRTVIQRGRAR